ncbi:ABC transporter ATP-binding protein [Pasteurella canis]|uniref:AAA family ATPase n=1 Tax=Pasteurella canis TaxID=753 RepID=UPI001E2D8998|nr:AAA family ATPase [Pasteurella canis]GJJ79798.1 ABC transporter ATP-binding protein [Pasteurella canis]
MKFDLNVNNLGKISNAQLKIRPFTVISGKNSSGKSFITRSLYSIFNVFNRDLTYTFLRNIHNEILIQLEIFSFRDEDYTESLKKLLSDIDFVENTYLNVGSVKNISKMDIKNKMTHIADRLSIFIKYLENYENKVERFFHRNNSLISNLKRLEKLIYDEESFELEYIESELKKSFCENFQISSLNNLINRTNNKNNAEISFGNAKSNLQDSSKSMLCNISIEHNAIDYKIYHSFINECKSFKNVLYLESPIYFRMLRAIRRVGKISIGSPKINLSGIPQYVYNMIEHLEDRRYVENSISLPILMKRVSEELKGRIDIKNSGLNISYIDEDGNDFPLEQTAMGIINLGILSLLINNGIIEKGSSIFIDEPETNLHPEWQILMLEILYALSVNGVNVVIATHSNSILKKIQKIIESKQNENTLELDFFGINYLKDGSSLRLNDNPLLATIEVLEDLNLPYASVEFGLM